MDLDERISKLKEEINIVPDEKDIWKTIEASRAGFIREEEKWTLPYHLFLYDQFRLIRKRWWIRFFASERLSRKLGERMSTSVASFISKRDG